MQHNMGKKIVENAAKRLAPRGGTDHNRPDLYLADYQRISTDTYRVLVGWASGLERPALPALENFVTTKFPQVALNHTTLKWHAAERVAEVVVGWIMPTRRLQDSKNMAKVGPCRFLEAGSNFVWEVREGEDGEKHLVRKTEDDLGELLKQRAKASANRTTPSFGRMANAGAPDVVKGDTVMYLSDGVVRQGKVQAVRQNEVVIRYGRKVEAVQTTNVTEVVTKDPATVQDYRERVRKYWSQIFPADYLNRWLSAGQEKK